jgi:hypothetical protein
VPGDRRYLALNLDAILDDLTEFSLTTWGMCVAFQAGGTLIMMMPADSKVSSIFKAGPPPSTWTPPPRVSPQGQGLVPATL